MPRARFSNILHRTNHHGLLKLTTLVLTYPLYYYVRALYTNSGIKAAQLLKDLNRTDYGSEYREFQP